MNVDDLVGILHLQSDPAFREKMERFNIPIENALGIRMPNLRLLAKNIGKDHQLAIDLWEYPIHEARILATLIADPKSISSERMDDWALNFESWDLCDQACSNLFDKSPFCIEKIEQWKSSEKEFVKRAAFVLMATSAMHHKDWDNTIFLKFLNYCELDCCDNRNFVKKAVNWAIRQIGKKNMDLHQAAMESLRVIVRKNCHAARWIAKDAQKELESEKILERLNKKRG